MALPTTQLSDDPAMLSEGHIRVSDAIYQALRWPYQALNGLMSGHMRHSDGLIRLSSLRRVLDGSMRHSDGSIRLSDDPAMVSERSPISLGRI